MYKFYLNNTLLTNPVDGWDDFTTKISRDIDNRRITITYPTDLIFTGDGFNILFNAIEASGYDTSFDFRAENQDDNNSILGIIFLIDVQFDLTKRTATVQIKENGFISRVWGNLNNPVSLPSVSTKNGLVQISTSRRFLGVAAAAGGLENLKHGGSRYCVDVFEALKDITSNVSDNNVTLVSDFLQNQLGNNLLDSKAVIIRGKELRLGNDRESENDYAIKCSFDQLFTAIGRIYDLYFYPDTTSESSILKVEKKELFYPFDSTESIESPENMTISYYQDLFYSAVRLGSARYSFQQGNTSNTLPEVPFVTFKSDDYTIDGKSNIDRRLDLGVDRFIIDSNIIRDVIINDNDQYDDDLFLIQYLPNFNAATFEQFGELIVNKGFLSSEIARRHDIFGKISNNLTDVGIDNRFSYRLRGADSISYISFEGSLLFESPAYPIFKDVLLDKTNGKYDPSNSIYTAQLNGQYTFNVEIYTGISSLITQYTNENDDLIQSNETVQAVGVLEIRNGDIVVQEVPLFNDKIKNIGAYKSVGVGNVSMSVNETARVKVIYLHCRVLSKTVEGSSIQYEAFFEPLFDAEWTLLGRSTFSCTDTPTLSLSYETKNVQNEYRGTRINIQHYLTQKQIKNILNAPQNSIELINFVEKDKKKPCWLKDIQINNITGSITGELITNIANTNNDLLRQPLADSRRVEPSDCDNLILCFANSVNSQYLAI